MEAGIAVFDREHCMDCGDCARACLPSAIISTHTGVDLYAGGCWDRRKQIGIRIALFLTEADAIDTVGRIKKWYRKYGQEGERLGEVMLREGVRTFQEYILQGIKQQN